jgi:hypothetical protein
MRPASVLLLAGLPLLMAATVCAQAAGDREKQAQITVAFSGAEDMVRPDIRNNIVFRHEFSVTLSNRNQISEHHVWRGGASDYDETFGRPQDMPGVLPSRVVWHVMPGNRLARIEDYAQSRETIEISISDKGCTAIVTEALKPGFSEFKFKNWTNDEVHFFSRREVDSVSCSIK